MLPGRCKNAIIISKLPIVQTGLKGVMQGQFADYELAYCRSVEELTLLQLRCADLVIADLSGDCNHPRSVCEQYYSLLSQYRDIHWVFLVSRVFYPLAIELLMCPVSSLLSDAETIESLVNVIHAGNSRAERISKSLLSPPVMPELADHSARSIVLTLSERKVLRLLGKGWGINQIATLLKKSNKTISAQKNSAMRRLSIHSNAEMYAWINSSQGSRELNLPSVYGETTEWKAEASKETLRW
ncbi:response regulator transcription factor [Citrobacter braakii]|jgi:DNA-binding NarL/FixJ family response regulator|uniref:helix-turn-helix transcriptional regulator n=1 Tax=Citrobacter TaxID=544 RepID=UPI0005426F07|nr:MULTISPECIES: response regulator transcription factor [Citrobacter]MCI1669804.1 response regulator transcription factor [Citrobacter freundii]EGT0650079.1 response regulator transcription factor [Citrobacter braakii]EIV2908251.1 response regulator transcription factor [Citrobacter braakii]KHE09153.1 transcriptional regulator [Citrobacter braakii]MBA7874480.1 response regulator transcription factor [Citrobacter sp. RHBSTW-00827]